MNGFFNRRGDATSVFVTAGDRLVVVEASDGRVAYRCCKYLAEIFVRI